ncbi:MAG: DMT family transporter [Bacteroidetes bacterium]|nr:MAG: DMT family transporter [Bacteroidota bacterium]
MNNKLKTYIAVVLSMIFWSFSFIWFKEANRTFHPITIVFIRLLLSVIILTVYLVLTRNYMKIKKGDRKLFLMMAMFEPFFYFLGESFGLTYVSATVCSVLISTIPVFATLGAWLIFKEQLKVINYAGIILSFIGVLVFILNRDGSISFNIKGLILIIIAVFSAVGYNLTLSRLVKTYSPVYIVNVQNIIGVVLFLPLFLILDFTHFINSPVTFNMFLPIIELAVFASCGAFILFAYSVRNMGISKANVFTNCIPVLTALFSFILMGEKLTFQNIIGMIIVIAGLFMSQMNDRKKINDDALALTGKTA